MGSHISKSLLYVVLIVLTGCASLGDRGAIPFEKLSLPLIGERVRENTEAIRTLAGQGYLIYESPDTQDRAQATVALVVPDSLILHIHGPFGVTYSSILIVGSHIKFYNRKNNEQYQGSLTNDVIRKLTGFDFLKQDIFEFFTGTIPLVSDSSAEVSFFQLNEAYRIFADQEPYPAIYRVAKNGRYILSAEWYDTDGRIFLEKTAENFNMTKGVHVPRIIRYTEPQAKRQLTMFYQDAGRSINTPIPSEKFILEIPSTAKEIILR